MKIPLKILVGSMILVLGLGACGPSPEQIATMTASAWTPTPLPTPTSTPIPYDLTVTVTDEEGAPIAGAGILLSESGSEESFQADEQGQFAWANLPGEAVTLEVSASGYHPQSLSQTILRGPNDLTVTLQRDPFGLLPSEACASGEKLLYIEDFQDGKAPGWGAIEAATDFAAQNGWGMTQLEEGNQVLSFSKVLENGDGLSDYTFDNAVWRLKVQYHGAEGFSFLNWRHTRNQDGESRYPVQWGAGGVLVALTRLEMPGAGHFDVGRSNQRMRADQWYFFEISTYDGLIQVWVDGKKLIEYQDPQLLPAGTIGLEVHMFKESDTAYYFDDFAICELGAPFQTIVTAP